MMDRFLEGRIAWVTDGLTSIGQATALALAEVGADVAFCSVVGTEGAADIAGISDDLSRRLAELGVRCFHSSIDLGSDASVDEVHSAAEDALGPIDILINSAGGALREDMIGHRDEIWKAVLDVNLNGAYRATKRCMGSMIERRFGRIVNIASTAANVGYPGHSAYCAAKSGLLGLARCVALEGAEHGVTCNTINPGWVEAATGQANLEEMPQRRLIPPEEVAGFIVFLCRDEALGLTGEAIAITGGAVSVVGSDGLIS